MHLLNALEHLHSRGCASVPPSPLPRLLPSSLFSSLRRPRRYIHRDVKPGNFTIGYGAPPFTPLPLFSQSSRSLHPFPRPSGSDHRSFYIIDLGLAKRFVDDKGELLPQGDGPSGFRGSSKHASVAAHAFADQCRRDDLWSLLYMLVEFVVGSLPWTQARVMRTRARVCAPFIQLTLGVPFL